MSKDHIKYVFFVCLIAFAVWLVGEVVLILAFPFLSMKTARIWVIVVFSTACIWSIRHMIREDKKRQEDEDNDNYKGVY